MKRVLLFAAFVVTATLSSCQCADKPPMSPVEGEESSAVMVTPEARA
ncbi:MAG: hypothetical protein AAF730_14270 [Bacteroidota bacterium]